MKITIDTKEDSHNEIRKAIQLLNNLLESRTAPSSRNIFDDPSPTIGMSMFDEKPSSPQSNAFSSMFGGDTPTPTKDYEDNNEYTSANNSDDEKSDDDYKELAKEHHIQFY